MMLKETLKTLTSVFGCSTFVSKNSFTKRKFMKTNQVLLIGYVGKGPQTTQTTKGSKGICIRMATHYRQSNTDGEPSFQTVWHNVVAWDQKAEYAERNFIKEVRSW